MQKKANAASTSTIKQPSVPAAAEVEPQQQPHTSTSWHTHSPYGGNAIVDYYQQQASPPPPAYDYTFQVMEACMASQYAHTQEVIVSHLVDFCARMRYVSARSQTKIEHSKWLQLFDMMPRDFQETVQTHVFLQAYTGLNVLFNFNRMVNTLVAMRNFSDLFRLSRNIQLTRSMDATNAMIDYYVHGSEMLAEVFSELSFSSKLKQ